MHSSPDTQADKLADLIRAAQAGRPSAERGTLFCSRSGLALVNAAFALFECDALYDLAGDVAHELAIDREGYPLDGEGERRTAGMSS